MGCAEFSPSSGLPRRDGRELRQLAVLRAQPHAQITPEIRRELLSGRVRGEAYIPSLAGPEAMALE